MMRMIPPNDENTHRNRALLVLDTLICLSVLDASSAGSAREQAQEEEVSVNEWVDVDEDYNVGSVGKVVETGRASVRKMMSL